MRFSACVRVTAPLLVLPLAITGSGALARSTTPPGAITRLARTCCTESVLHTFDRLIDGSKAFNLVAGKAGVLYGMTFQGGFDGVGCPGGEGCGTIFKLTPAGSAYRASVLYKFKGTVQHFAIPGGGLLVDASGALYGTIWWTGNNLAGSVYKLTPSKSGYTESDLYDFQGPPSDGEGPSGDLLADSTGALYGSTLGGGGTGCGASTGCGTVFKLSRAATKPRSRSAYKETILYRFQGGADGRYPNGNLVADASGALYGTTQGDACESDCGSVFKLTPQASGGYTASVLHHFGNTPDGADPVGGLILDQTGALYGATAGGGTNGLGSVYRLTPQGSGAYDESILYSFQGRTDGATPTLERLLADKSGAIYGTTLSGGDAGCYRFGGCGTVFKLTPKSSGVYTESILHSFGSSPDGAEPVGTLIIDQAGALYGTTRGGGGTRHRGTVFRLTQ